MLDQISDFFFFFRETDFISIVNSKGLWVTCNFLHLQVYRCCVLHFETWHSVWLLGSVGSGLSFLVVCVHSCPLSFLFVCFSPPFMSDFETTDLLVWNKNNNEWMNYVLVCCNSSVILMVIFAPTELFFWPLTCLPCAVPLQVSSIWKWVQ